MAKINGVILWRTYAKLRRKWIVRLVVVNLFYLAVLGGVGYMTNEEHKKVEVIINQNLKIEEFKIKREIYEILRIKGISLSQGLDIADIVFSQCKELNLPPKLVMAVMSKESDFSVTAISPKKALGIMQIHPITWTEYVEKLKLNVSYHAAFDPIVNIRVATHIIKDYYEFYRVKIKGEPEIWKYTLSAYYAGKASLSDGIQSNHQKYIQGVVKFNKEYERRETR